MAAAPAPAPSPARISRRRQQNPIDRSSPATPGREPGDSARLAAAFLELSGEDLATARLILPDIPRQAALHLQQAAERLVKAELALAGKEPPRHHDIGALARQLPPGHPRTPALVELADLTPYIVTARYPLGDTVSSKPDPDELSRYADLIEALLAATPAPAKA